MVVVGTATLSTFFTSYIHYRTVSVIWRELKTGYAVTTTKQLQHQEEEGERDVFSPVAHSPRNSVGSKNDDGSVTNLTKRQLSSDDPYIVLAFVIRQIWATQKTSIALLLHSIPFFVLNVVYLTTHSSDSLSESKSMLVSIIISSFILGFKTIHFWQIRSLIQKRDLLKYQLNQLQQKHKAQFNQDIDIEKILLLQQSQQCHQDGTESNPSQPEVLAQSDPQLEIASEMAHNGNVDPSRNEKGKESSQHTTSAIELSRLRIQNEPSLHQDSTLPRLHPRSPSMSSADGIALTAHGAAAGIVNLNELATTTPPQVYRFRSHSHSHPVPVPVPFPVTVSDTAFSPPSPLSTNKLTEQQQQSNQFISRVNVVSTRTPSFPGSSPSPLVLSSPPESDPLPVAAPSPPSLPHHIRSQSPLSQPSNTRPNAVMFGGGITNRTLSDPISAAAAATDAHNNAQLSSIMMSLTGALDMNTSLRHTTATATTTTTTSTSALSLTNQKNPNQKPSPLVTTYHIGHNTTITSNSPLMKGSNSISPRRSSHETPNNTSNNTSNRAGSLPPIVEDRVRGTQQQQQFTNFTNSTDITVNSHVNRYPPSFHHRSNTSPPLSPSLVPSIIPHTHHVNGPIASHSISNNNNNNNNNNNRCDTPESSVIGMTVHTEE